MRAMLAVVGLTLVVAVAAIVVAVLSLGSGETSWTDLEVGECLDLAAIVADADGDLADVETVEPVPCEEQHDAEVAAVGALNPDGGLGYPSQDDLLAIADAACAGLAPSLDADGFGLLPIVPDARTWEQREGRVACLAVVRGGGMVVGSALGKTVPRIPGGAGPAPVPRP